jgi:hypothetical protein
MSSQSVIVTEIHDNSLGSCRHVESVPEGIDVVRLLAQSKMNRNLTTEEDNILTNDYEVRVDLPDGTHCWSVGFVE